MDEVYEEINMLLRTYNAYRKSEVIAELISLSEGLLKVRFKGKYCTLYSKVVNWASDFEKVASSYGVRLKFLGYEDRGINYEVCLFKLT